MSETTSESEEDYESREEEEPEEPEEPEESNDYYDRESDEEGEHEQTEEITYNPEDYDQEETDTFPDDFADLRDIYRIHRNNLYTYGSLGSNLPPLQFGLGYGQASYSNTNQDILSCPLCGEWLHYPEVATHVQTHHAGLYLSMNILLNQNITLENVQDILNNMYTIQYQSSMNTITRTYNTLQSLLFLEGTGNEPTYDDLLSLCDFIGYHKPGIKDVDAFTTLVGEEDKKRLIEENETCRICLECFEYEQDVRKINSCNHAFCSECIKTWFLENKTCPLCNLDVTGGATEEPKPTQGTLEDPD